MLRVIFVLPMDGLKLKSLEKINKPGSNLFLDLPHGIPVEDTYRRIFAVLDPKDFQQRFSKWIQATIYVKRGAVIAKDPKQKYKKQKRQKKVMGGLKLKNVGCPQTLHG